MNYTSHSQNNRNNWERNTSTKSQDYYLNELREQQKLSMYKIKANARCTEKIAKI